MRGFIVSALRNASRRWPPKYETLNAAKTTKKVNKKTKRIAQHFKCASCKKEFPQKEVQVDHIVPVAANATTWDDYINNLFCDSHNLQVLCIGCHKKKTAKEKNESK